MSRLPPTMWVTADKIFAQLFGLIIFAVQAPILGPHAFGLLAAVMVFVGFWEAVPGAAATDALISVHDIEHGHYSAVVVTTTLLALVIGVAIWGFAEPLGAALGDANLVPVMRAMAVLPLIQALSIAPTAAAQRDMLFRSLTIRTIVSLLAGGFIGMVLALVGAGVWALVWQALVQRCVAAVILWVAVPTPFTKGVSRRHLREVSEFALPNMLSRIMSWASGQIPRLILGFYLGPTRLGLFTLATRLNDIVNQIAILPKTLVARVDLRRYATNREALGVAVRRVFLHVGLAAFPLCVGGAAITPPLVDSWLDARWHGAIVPSQILLLMGVPFVAIYVSASLLLALNRQKWEAAICTVQSIGMVAAVAAAAPYGVAAAAAAMTVVSSMTVPLVIYVMHQRCGVSLRNILSPQLAPFAAACLMGATIVGVRAPLEASLGGRAAVPIEILAGAVLYAAFIAVTMPKPTVSALNYLSHLLATSTGEGGRDAGG